MTKAIVLHAAISPNHASQRSDERRRSPHADRQVGAQCQPGPECRSDPHNVRPSLGSRAPRPPQVLLRRLPPFFPDVVGTHLAPEAQKSQDKLSDPAWSLLVLGSDGLRLMAVGHNHTSPVTRPSYSHRRPSVYAEAARHRKVKQTVVRATAPLVRRTQTRITDRCLAGLADIARWSPSATLPSLVNP